MSISAIVYTFNEEIHIERCIRALRESGCDDIIVVDSYSTDCTVTCCKELGVPVYQREFTGFGDQRNWSLVNCEFKHKWILILDADEIVTTELWAEACHACSTCPSDVVAFRVRRRLYMWNKWLRYSSLYPTWVVRLIRLGKIRYVNRGHGETQIVDGKLGSLVNDLLDENLKGIDDWFEKHIRYARKEAEFELNEVNTVHFRHLFHGDPLVRRQVMKLAARTLPLRGVWYFFYTFLVRFGFMDGAAGFRFCIMKAIYQQMIALRKGEIRQNHTWTRNIVAKTATRLRE